jgi:hypothetical protein
MQRVVSRRPKGLRQQLDAALGQGQYRNAVASGQAARPMILGYLYRVDPTLPRYGTDPVRRRAT